MTEQQARDGRRSVTMSRVGAGRFEAQNVRGGRISLGTGDSSDFTPVELLLAAIAGCSGIDVDMLTARRAEPEQFDMVSAGEKVSDEDGNHLRDLEVTFTVRFPEGEGGDKAREMLPRAIEASHDRLCTVSRTVALGTPVTLREA
ncbi:OsmC family protein [Mobilicoccus massiliensis]|uniref:OsmC family protein n=1 Tax=Mobilicoccus massiliensis TaxID=1522310 RepID=UPI00058EF15E|nr:OsmC family protein [Mobilicoccus massiliensis]